MDTREKGTKLLIKLYLPYSMANISLHFQYLQKLHFYITKLLNCLVSTHTQETFYKINNETMTLRCLERMGC